MTYHLQDRLDHVGSRFKEINGETVILSRNGEDTPNVIACPIIKSAEELFPGVAVTRVEYQDWAIDCDQYIIAGAVSTPQSGDLIYRRDGSIFQLVSTGSNEPAFRYMTSSRRRYLLHSQMTQRPKYTQDYPQS